MVIEIYYYLGVNMNRIRIIAAVFAVLAVSTVSASNLNFLHDAAPISDFNRQDVKIMEDTIQKALNEIKDGEKLAWTNEKTKHSGLVNPLSSYTKDGMECRKVRIVNKSKKRIAQNNFKYCKQDDIWVLMRFKKEK